MDIVEKVIGLGIVFALNAFGLSALVLYHGFGLRDELFTLGLIATAVVILSLLAIIAMIWQSIETRIDALSKQLENKTTQTVRR